MKLSHLPSPLKENLQGIILEILDRYDVIRVSRPNSKKQCKLEISVQLDLKGYVTKNRQGEIEDCFLESIAAVSEFAPKRQRKD